MLHETYVIVTSSTTQRDKEMTKLMNLQGQLFTEQQAREYYGDRYETAILEWVKVNEDGEVI